MSTVRSRVRAGNAYTDRLAPLAGRCTLKLKTRVTVVSDYLFVGSGRTDVVDGRTVKKHYRSGGRVAIPGSTLKGAMRSRVELGAYGGGREVLAEMLYDSGPLGRLPPIGTHGWRHARVWCESVVYEQRVKEGAYSALEDLVGTAAPVGALGSRVLVSEHAMVRGDVELVELDHGEALEAVKRGAVFEGELVGFNLSLEELGVLAYGLGQDKKVVCGRAAQILLGASKYRVRSLQRVYRGRWVSASGTARFGVVQVDVVGVEFAPWQPCGWPRDADALLRAALDAALRSYPELRACFDEVERVSILASDPNARVC